MKRFDSILTNKTLLFQEHLGNETQSEMWTSIQMGKYDDVWYSTSRHNFILFCFPFSLHPLPPGCVSISCAHMRAYEYFAESVYPGNEQNFMGNKCTSLTALNSQLCPGRRFPMGFAVPRNLKGNLFLTTNEESPYGQNQGKGKKQSCNRVAS